MNNPPKEEQNLCASVIIAAFNRRDDLAECLTPLTREKLSSLNAEIIVVDDVSTDGTVEMLAERFPHVRIVKNAKNMGPGPARNTAVAQAAGNLLVFIDSDAVPCDGWLETIIGAADDKTVLIGRVLDYKTGKVQYGPRRATFFGKSLRSRPERANTGPTANLAIPRRLFDRVGGFDPDIPYYFEDSWLCIRLGRIGTQFKYVSDAIVRHKGATARQGDEIRMQEHNSTYAMLKLYADTPVRRMVFSVGNGLWMALRWICWTFSGRSVEAKLLWRGWVAAYRRFAEKSRKVRRIWLLSPAVLSPY